MTDFNQAVVLGNLTRDPEMRYTPNGRAVTSFSVATNRRWTNRETNEQQEETEFHNIVAWGKLAEICNQILYKGRKVLVVGRLRTRNWEGQDGVKRYSTEIVADHISATGPPKTVSESSLEAGARAPEPESAEPKKKEEKSTPASKESTDSGKNEEIDLEDIPF